MFADPEQLGGGLEVEDVALLAVELAAEEVLDHGLLGSSFGATSLVDALCQTHGDLGADGDAGRRLIRHGPQA